MAIIKRCPACGRKLENEKCVNPKCVRAVLAAELEKAKKAAELAKNEMDKILEAQREQAKEQYFNDVK